MEKLDYVSNAVLHQLVVCGVLALIIIHWWSFNAAADSGGQSGIPIVFKGAGVVQTVVPQEANIITKRQEGAAGSTAGKMREVPKLVNHIPEPVGPSETKSQRG